MASFQKRGKTWQYTISRMVNGVQDPIRKSGFSTKKEAQIAAQEVEEKLRKGYNPNIKPIPFSQYFKEWVQIFRPKIEEATKKNYDYTYNKIDEYFGNTPIQSILKRDYQRFLNNLGEDLAKVTVNKINSRVRACVLEAIDEKIIQIDFTRNAIISGKDSKRRDEKYISYNESKLLLNEIYNRMHLSKGYYLLLLALTTGMRFGEIVGLTTKDLDFKKNIIHINKTWGYTSSMPKGFGDTKTYDSTRIISVDKNTMEAFQELFKKLPKHPHGLIFYSPHSKYKVISNGSANKLLRNTLKRLGIDTITVHGLRHTHISILLYKKVSINYVSERAGHASVETTYKHYSHILKEMRTEDEKLSISIFKDMKTY